MAKLSSQFILLFGIWGNLLNVALKSPGMHESRQVLKIRPALTNMPDSNDSCALSQKILASASPVVLRSKVTSKTAPAYWSACFRAILYSLTIRLRRVKVNFWYESLGVGEVFCNIYVLRCLKTRFSLTTTSDMRANDWNESAAAAISFFLRNSSRRPCSAVSRISIRRWSDYMLLANSQSYLVWHRQVTAKAHDAWQPLSVQKLTFMPLKTVLPVALKANIQRCHLNTSWFD